MKRFALLVLASIVFTLLIHAAKSAPLAGTELGNFLSDVVHIAYWAVFMLLLTPGALRCRLLRRRESTRESN